MLLVLKISNTPKSTEYQFGTNINESDTWAEKYDNPLYAGFVMDFAKGKLQKNCLLYSQSWWLFLDYLEM